MSFLNFLRWIAPGGFRHLRSGWDSANESGAMDQWGSGAKGSSAHGVAVHDAVVPTDEEVAVLRTRGVREAPPPAKPAQLGVVYGRQYRSHGLRRCVEFPRLECFYGRPLHPGKWFRLGRQGGIWEELWVLRKTLQTWRELLAGDLVVARMNNSTAIAYADYGAGRVPRLTMLGREVEEREVAIGCAVAALHISVGGSMVADTPSRFSVQVRGLGPYPERELRKKFRSVVQGRCGTVVFDMMARGDGL